MPALRLELKYVLDPFVYRAVQAVVRGHMRRDRFTRRAAAPGYVVRSLYYDSYDGAAYVEKLVGESTRVKARARSYDVDPARASFVSVELKCRQAQAIIKHGARVPVADYQAFAATGAWPGEADDVCLAFERALRRRHQRPRVLVEYRREAYEPRGPGGLRVTFDHRVRVARADALFDPRPRWRSAARHDVVLEIKTAQDLPRWLERAIVDFELTSVPNSKYTQAIEQAYPGVMWR